MGRFLWLQFRYKNERLSGKDLTYGHCMDGSILREICVNRIVIGQGHQAQVMIVPPRGTKVPKGVDMLAFYKQMLYGLLRFTHMTRVTVSNFGLEKFFASVQDVMVYFKLKHRTLYLFFVSLNGRTYNAAIV